MTENGASEAVAPAPACPTCGAADGLNVRADNGQLRAPDGTMLPYETAYTSCARCGEEFLTSAQTRADSRAASAVLRHYLGLLSGDEIRAIRSTLGVSQDELEQVLGLGRKTVVRWETGKVNQGRAADLLLRAIQKRPELFYEFAERAGTGAGR